MRDCSFVLSYTHTSNVYVSSSAQPPSNSNKLFLMRLRPRRAVMTAGCTRHLRYIDQFNTHFHNINVLLANSTAVAHNRYLSSASSSEQPLSFIYDLLQPTSAHLPTESPGLPSAGDIHSNHRRQKTRHADGIRTLIQGTGLDRFVDRIRLKPPHFRRTRFASSIKTSSRV